VRLPQMLYHPASFSRALAEVSLVERNEKQIPKRIDPFINLELL
jgi:hypothetical protein